MDILSRIEHCNFDENEENFPEQFLPLVELFEKDGGKLKKCFIDHNKLIINCENKNVSNELMMRFAIDIENSLIVARIEFAQQRQGNMTKLYNILKQIQKNCGFSPIAIENVNSTSMETWCVKNDFEENHFCPRYYIEPSGTTFEAVKKIEEDGSVTLSLIEIDLTETEKNEDESKKKLAEALMKYTENCMKNLASLISDSSRKAQISKLFRIKDLNASEIIEKIKCINS